MVGRERVKVVPRGKGWGKIEVKGIEMKRQRRGGNGCQLGEPGSRGLLRKLEGGEEGGRGLAIESAGKT